MTAQLEDLDAKHSSADRSARSLKEQLEEAQVRRHPFSLQAVSSHSSFSSSFLVIQERLTEENRAKISANNKQKQLSDEVERLNQQLEDEEEAKAALQNKLAQITQQVKCTTCKVPVHRIYALLCTLCTCVTSFHKSIC